MTAFNDFTEITWNDGASPPINAANLNAIEGVVGITDLELARSKSFQLNKYLQYFRKRNQKDICLFNEDYSVYDNGNPTECTLSNETTLNKLNDLCLKMTIAIAGAGYLDAAIDLSSALDLTEFFDESASSTGDHILLMFYLSDIAAYSGGLIYFNIGNGSTANTYEYDFDVDAWGFDTGWNVAWVPKSDFYVWAGAPNWNNIDFVQVEIDFNAGYQNEYMLVQLCQMNRHDPDDSDYFNAFQKYLGSVSGWENKFTQDYPVWSLVNDEAEQVNKLGIMKLNPENFEAPFTPDNYKNGMLIYENVNCFISRFEWICKEAGELPSMTFYIDSTHYAEVYITSDILYLSVANGGAAVDTTWSFSNSLVKNEKIITYFEKHNDTLRVIASKQGEIIAVCEYETTFSSPGDIYLGVNNGSSFGILIDFSISHSMSQLNLVNEYKPTVIKKLANESVSSSTTLQDDNHLFAYLRPNETYIVELYLRAACTSDDRDIKVAWELTNCEQITSRNVIGPSVSTTSTYASSIKISCFEATEQAVYGVTQDTTRTANIVETFIIKAGETGGKIQLQWAQYSSGAQNLALRSNSYMILTPVNMQ